MHVKKTAHLTGHQAAVFALTQGREERQLLSAGDDGWIVEWNLDQPDLGRLLAKVDAHVFSICFLKNEEKIVAGDMNGGVYWIHLDTNASVQKLAQHRKGVFDLLACAGHVFSAGGDGCLTRWDAAAGQPLDSVQLSHQPLRCLDFSPDRQEIAIGSSDGNIYLLDAATLALRRTIAQAHAGSVFSICYIPGGRHLLSGGRDAQLKIRELENEDATVFSEAAHWYTINDIVFHPQGHLFATASRDKTVKIWDTATFQLLKVLEGARDGGHFNSVNKLHWSTHEYTLVSAGDDRTLILWKAIL